MKIKVIGVILLFISIITIVVSCMMFDLNTKYIATFVATLILGIAGLFISLPLTAMYLSEKIV